MKLNLTTVVTLILLCFSLNADEMRVTILTKRLEQSNQGLWEHPSVVRSIKCGLAKIGVRFSYNPSKVQEVYENVLVLSDMRTVQQAVALKRQGKIKKLFIGPNFSIADFCQLQIYPEIDYGLAPSEWAKNAYLANQPLLNRRFKIWPSGVDTDSWKPTQASKKERSVLVYLKGELTEMCAQVEAKLKKKGWNVCRITYGSYTPRQYKETLEKSAFCVFLSRSESQGLALCEAWSMNVPTLCWDPQTTFCEGRTYPSSSCPYLTKEQGKRWYDLAELDSCLNSIEDELTSYCPRAWMLEHMSDEVSARQLMQLFKD